MKHLKALEILKILAEDYEYNIEDNSKVLEAITELEILQDEVRELRFKCTTIQADNEKLKLWFNAQKPKTRDGCRFYHSETYLEHAYCASSMKCSLWNYKNYYEPKEQT